MTVSLGSILIKKKPPNIEVRGLIYRIPCAQCPWSYVGETGRTLLERIKEHKRAVSKLSTSSEIANHSIEADHRIDWEKAEVLDRESWHSKRLFKEAWYTQKYSSSNRVFSEIDRAWLSFID